MKNFNFLSPLAIQKSASQVQVIMKNKNEKLADVVKDFTVFSILFAIAWSIYHLAYAEGVESKESQCRIVHGYIFNDARPAFKMKR